MSEDVSGPSLQSIIDFQATGAAQRPKHVAPTAFGWKIFPAAPAVYLVGRKESPGLVWKVCGATAGGQQQLHPDELCRTVSSKYFNSNVSVAMGREMPSFWLLAQNPFRRLHSVKLVRPTASEKPKPQNSVKCEVIAYKKKQQEMTVILIRGVEPSGTAGTENTVQVQLSLWNLCPSFKGYVLLRTLCKSRLCTFCQIMCVCV